jgi:HAD superfamily hydrolase (TIGR01490 family)
LPRAAAFFDLDRTLMAGSSGLPWARAARRAGLVKRRQLARWGLDGLRFRLRGASDEATERVLAEIKLLLRGVSARQLERLAPDVLAGVLPRIYPEMLAEVHAHQDAGRPVFIVSAAGDELVQMIARVLYMDGGIGTAYEIDPEGVMTGELGGPFMYGEGKVEAMRTYAGDHDIDLGQSWAYSDAVSDLPMLRAVGNPVAVNPDAELSRIAREQGWRVMRFERLARRLAIVGATLVAAAVGGGGRAISRRRRAGLRRRSNRVGSWTKPSSRSRGSRVRRS